MKKIKKNNFIYGAVILTICGLISKAIGAFYRIPLLSLMGSDGLGIYQLVFPIYALFLVISSSGIMISMSKKIAKEYATRNKKNVNMYFKSCLAMMFVFGTFLSIIFCLLAPLLSKMQNNADAVICYYGIAPAILFSCFLSCFKGYFQGRQNMLPSGLTQIIEQLFKLASSLLLVKILMPKGLVYGVLGAILGVSLSEFASLIIIFTLFLFSKIKHRAKPSILTNKTINKLNVKLNKIFYFENKLYLISFWQAVRNILKDSFSIMLNALIIPLTGAIDSIIIVPLLVNTGLPVSASLSLFGIEDGIVGSLVSLPSVVALGLGTAIIPSISSANFTSKKAISNKVKLAIKIIWLVSLPCICAFLLFSSDITSFLYAGGLHSKYFDELKIASDLLKLNAFNIAYISLTNLTTSVLQACNKNLIPVKNLAFASIFRLIFIVIFVPNKNFGIYAVALADVICFSLTVVLNMMSLKKNMNIKFFARDMFVFPSISVAIMGIVMLLCKKFFQAFITARALTISTIAFGFVVYVVLLLITKVFNKNEIRNLANK